MPTIYGQGASIDTGKPVNDNRHPLEQKGWVQIRPLARILADELAGIVESADVQIQGYPVSDVRVVHYFLTKPYGGRLEPEDDVVESIMIRYQRTGEAPSFVAREVQKYAVPALSMT